MSKKNKKPNYFRLAIIWAIILLLSYMVTRSWVDSSYNPDFETYCPFGGLQAISSWGVLNSLACSMTSLQITMGLTLLLASVLFSKLFCGYLCPIGIFSEWFGKIGDKFNIRYTIKGITDKILRFPKYALLFITFYFTVGSSELFCRQYDPFYAVFTGFGHDVVLWYAIPGLIITTLGAIFFRLFWCKYLCPLGAVTNIFTWFIPFILVLGSFITLRISGVNISWIWPLVILCLGGYVLEIWKMGNRRFPLFKITRHDGPCTHCNICTKACPQGIDVMKLDTIHHVDCNLCGQCLSSCPEKGALKINGRDMKWFPALVTVLVVATGVLLGTNMVQIPTVDERWGSEEALSNAAVYHQSGIKEIKCFGSSRSFVEKMRGVEGVLGVATFVSDRSVKIMYDPAILNPEKIKQLIFSPVKYLISLPETKPSEISFISFGIDRFFDRYDAGYLESILDMQEGLIALETEFGEPVKAILYYDPARFNTNGLKALIEKPAINLGDEDNPRIVNLDFKLAPENPRIGKLSFADFSLRIFEPYSNTFNEFEKYDSAQIQKIDLALPLIADPYLGKWIPFLESHISQDEGIVGWETFLSGNQPMVRLLYLPAKTNPAGFANYLLSDSLKVSYNTGEKENVVNPFK